MSRIVGESILEDNRAFYRHSVSDSQTCTFNGYIENPLEGKPLAVDDSWMLELEAYTAWERRGVKLEPGKH